MSHKVILFDLDGTLIDSPKFWEQAYRETFAPMGITFTEEHFREFYPTGAALGEWMTWLNIDPSLQTQIRTERDRIYEELLRTQIEWIDGATSALEAIRKKYPVGIVTGSHRSYIHTIDERLPLSETVEYILTDDDFDDKAHGLRMCMEHFTVTPEECLYIGDMPFDEEAALATNITFRLTPNVYTPQDLRNRNTPHTLEEITRTLL